MLKGLQWPLWLPEAWHNIGCIHHLANPSKGCANIVNWLVSVAKWAVRKSDIYDCLVTKKAFIILYRLAASLVSVE